MTMRGFAQFLFGLTFLILALAASKYILRKTQFAHFADAY